MAFPGVGFGYTPSSSYRPLPPPPKPTRTSQKDRDRVWAQLANRLLGESFAQQRNLEERRVVAGQNGMSVHIIALPKEVLYKISSYLTFAEYNNFYRALPKRDIMEVVSVPRAKRWSKPILRCLGEYNTFLVQMFCCPCLFGACVVSGIVLPVITGCGCCLDVYQKKNPCCTVVQERGDSKLTFPSEDRMVQAIRDYGPEEQEMKED